MRFMLAAVFLVLITGANAAPMNLGWKDLQKLNLTTGRAPAALQKFENKTVKIAGYVVPLVDFNWNNISEFLLVPSPTACIHTPPPPPNQMIYVKMKAKRKLSFQYGEPVFIIGEIMFKTERSPYGNVAVSMQGEASAEYK